MFVCVDDGSRMTRSTIMETSYTQKFDSQSFVSVSTVNFKNFQPSVNLILNISSFTFLLFFLFVCLVSGGTMQTKSFSYSSSSSSTSKKIGRSAKTSCRSVCTFHSDVAVRFD